MTRVVALDVGGTHVSAATVDVGSAAVVSASHVRTELVSGSRREELLDRIGDTASAALSGGVDAAGVAVPGPFDYARGICLLEHKLESLYGIDLRGELAVALSLAAEERPVRERRRGVPPRRVVGGCRAGTRPSARDHDRHRARLGVPRARPHRAHRLAGASRGGAVPPALPRRAGRGADLARRSAGSLRREGVDVAEIAVRAREGERRAREAFDVLSTDLADFLRPWLEAFAPSCLVVGGSIARSWDLLQGGLDSLGADVAVVAPAEHIDDAPLLGAARHAVTERAA